MSKHHSASAWWLMVAVPAWLFVASPLIGVILVAIVLLLAVAG